MLGDEAERGEVVDHGAVERGLGVEVESARLHGAGRLAKRSWPASRGLGHLDLVPEQPLENAVRDSSSFRACSSWSGSASAAASRRR